MRGCRAALFTDGLCNVGDGLVPMLYVFKAVSAAVRHALHVSVKYWIQCNKVRDPPLACIACRGAKSASQKYAYNYPAALNAQNKWSFH
jgi:hypothetical protein